MKHHNSNLSVLLCITVLAGFVFTGCAGKLPAPGLIIAPEPILDNSGEYMCPYTQDEVLADWVDMAIKAKIGSQVGRTVGAVGAQTALRQIPFVGGLIGGYVGEKIGRAIAIKAAGGMDHIKETSDLSFSSIDDMGVWLYANYSTGPKSEHYKDALEATFEIYPELKERYIRAIRNAPLKPVPEENQK